jgi:diaminopimelate decarboxylase
MTISRIFLDKIAAKHGPSFYLLDSRQFEDNFVRLASAFQKYYPKTTIAYSYKTNYVPRYCEIVSNLGGYAEVV